MHRAIMDKFYFWRVRDVQGRKLIAFTSRASCLIESSCIALGLTDEIVSIEMLSSNEIKMLNANARLYCLDANIVLAKDVWKRIKNQ